MEARKPVIEAWMMKRLKKSMKVGSKPVQLPWSSSGKWLKRSLQTGKSISQLKAEERQRKAQKFRERELKRLGFSSEEEFEAKAIELVRRLGMP
jgi:hypothetical protein